ncbi:hypothetical protein SDC9_168787 [bioreactor metagenome]|uniref:RNA polymerase sigma-70 region 2 domain-containing protein n=1 Tax=bioreactor metagenome TaxID=1076179 RepID=A0A645G3H0_9ZZZZ|nr:hypothetical protein [Christensenella sp.]
MITNALQKRIHFGDREAFLAIYHEYGRGVYAAARRALSSDELAQNAVRQTFLTLYEEILTEMEDFDIPVRIRTLTQREILLMRLVSGEASAEAVAEALIAKPDDDPEQSSARSAFLAEDDATPDLPILERTRTYRRPKRALFARKRGKKRPPIAPAGLFVKLLVLLLDLILLWALAGVLMSLGYLPPFDLGYSWFSQLIYPFFSPGA